MEIDFDKEQPVEGYRIAVFGCTGMLGGRLMSVLRAAGFSAVAVPEDKIDIRDYSAVEDALTGIKPAAVVNCAAYTDVDGCETNQELAYAVNAKGAGNIARAAFETGAAVLHISTDYVFDGTKRTPYTEIDPTGPRGVYALSKWEGEKAVMAEGGTWFIVRTAWLYGSGGKNFVDTIIRLASEREKLTIVGDQFGSPTYTGHLAAAITRVLSLHLNSGFGESGVFHVTGGGSCSWCDFARAIVELRPGVCKEVSPITADQYAANLNRPSAPRPNYSVLSNLKVKQKFGIVLPAWQDALAEYVNEYHPV